MPRDWRRLSIADCAADTPYATQIGPFGKAIMAEDYVSEGVPVLRGANVNHGRFHDDDFVYISEAAAENLAKFESFPGDVLLVHKGTLGQIGLMPEKRRFEKYIMGNSMLRVRCNPDVLLPEFLYYWLSSPGGQHYLFSRVSQVGVPQLQRPLTTLRQATLEVPPLPEQRAVVSVLGAIDNKVEANRRMNASLSEMAYRIFRAWFVDYEPVLAKGNGASGFPGMPSEVFDALPDSLEVSKAGRIPAGWDACALSSLVELIGGGTPKRKVSEYWGGHVPWFSVRDAPDESDVWVTTTQESVTELGLENSSARLMRPGTTIISARGTVGRLALTGVPMAMNQSCYGVQGVDGLGDYFVYFMLRAAVAELRQRTHGSVFDTITRPTFDGLLRARPPARLLEAFELTVAPYMRLVLSNREQDSSLIDVQEASLPALVAGSLRLPPNLRSPA